jgi:hypothetical protein
MNKIVRDYSIIIYRAHHYKYLDRICTLSFIQTGSLQFWEHGSANFDFKKHEILKLYRLQTL